MRFAAGDRLGPYEILAPLGAGGMGEVYRARDPRLGRDIALKVLASESAADPDYLRRFELEARVVAGLNHPNIVTLHSVEEAEGVRFLTMELVEGQDLRELLRDGPLPFLRVQEIALSVADALATAHERHVVHRDLKPANVMVTREGRVKVLDFGLAKRLLPSAHADDSQAVTMSEPRSIAGQVIGTVAYMAPEQLRGETVDGRADLFALGVLLHELLIGEQPFRGPSLIEVVHAILHVPAPALEDRRPELPAEFAHLVARCLEKDPARRFGTAGELRDALARVRQGADSGRGYSPAAGVSLPAPADDGSIAVLPFANRSPESDDDWFADGMTEDVIAQLSRVRTLKVISRASVMAFRDQESQLRAVAEKLRVASVLTGSVRRSGDRVRIVTELIDAPSGRSLWSQTFDRELTDIFAVQSDVALQIADALEARLSPEEAQRIHRKPTRDLLAYEHYLRGRHCFSRFTAGELRNAIVHFRQAIERDPEFALAYVGVALASAELAETGSGSREENGTQALAAAAKAIELAPDLSEAHCAHAHSRLTFADDWAAAEAGFLRAIALGPSNADAYDFYGRMCAGIGRFEEAIGLHELAFELDPLTHRTDIATTLLRAGRAADAERAARRSIELDAKDARPRATLGWATFRQGRLEEGIAALEHAAGMASDDVWIAQLGEAYGLAGRHAEAREQLRRLEDPARAKPAAPYHLAYVYTGLGDYERAIDRLEEAWRIGSGPVTTIGSSFLFEALREHPRFQALVEKLGVR